MSDVEKIVALQTEVQLLRWSDSSSNGRTVTFQLPRDGEFDPTENPHPLAVYAAKSGRNAGHRFMMVLVELGDDEQPVVQQKAASQQAAILCKDMMFWEWAAERSICTIENEEDARQWILNGAGITSRKQLDTNRAANDWFRHMILHPFQQYIKTISERVL